MSCAEGKASFMAQAQNQWNCSVSATGAATVTGSFFLTSYFGASSIWALDVKYWTLKMICM
jgi:hypothetical protein